MNKTYKYVNQKTNQVLHFIILSFLIRSILFLELLDLFAELAEPVPVPIGHYFIVTRVRVSKRRVFDSTVSFNQVENAQHVIILVLILGIPGVWGRCPGHETVHPLLVYYFLVPPVYEIVVRCFVDSLVPSALHVPVFEEAQDLLYVLHRRADVLFHRRNADEGNRVRIRIRVGDYPSGQK